MIYLILSVLVSASLIFIFKLFQHFNVHTFQAIVINYVVCVGVGLFFPGGTDVLQPEIFTRTWAYFAMALGTIFIITFYLMALTTQKVGVTATSVAAKISLVIPVLFSLLILKSSLKEYTIINYIGMAAALVAIVLSSIRPKKNDEVRTSTAMALLLPLIIFLNSGIADSLINYTNRYHLQPHEASQFTMLTFATSAVAGGIVLLYQLFILKTPFMRRSLWAGVALGIPNYFSIFFLIMALSAFGNDGAFLYPVNNIGIILVGAIGAVIFFKEKLTKLNLVGIGLAILALILISYQEILANLV
jgi:drug/metabolite transporter (DMT)-like permease